MVTNRIHISTDQAKLDLALITDFLSQQSYWAKGRAKSRILTSIENSLSFGIYSNEGHQIGFARVVTDFAVFAWIMDVFIVPEERGKGYSKYLISNILNHQKLSTISRWGLNTSDAHGLYEQFGFTKVKSSDIYMEKLVSQES